MPALSAADAGDRDWIITYTHTIERHDPNVFWLSDDNVVDEPVLDPPASTPWWHNAHAARQAWDRAWMWRAEDDRLDAYDVARAVADVADDIGSDSVAETALAIGRGCGLVEYGYATVQGHEMNWAANFLGWPRTTFSNPDTYADWEPEENEPPHHERGCDCDDCNPCECGDDHCERCSPDGPNCDDDCARCNPGRQYDDMGDDDDFEGLPEMPVAPPGRCRFGIEIEFNDGDRRGIMNALQRHGFGCLDLGYTHEVTRHWKMTTDGSVSGGELVSPVMSGDDASIEQVREAIRLVKQGGGTTGRNVGMHVHLDVTEFRTPELVTLVKNLRACENLLAGFVPSWRWDGTRDVAAELLNSEEWDEIAEWIDSVNPLHRERTRANRGSAAPVTRYRSFNFNSLLTYGTVECRLLGHTLNTIKVRTWIRTLQAIIEACRQQVVLQPGDILTQLVDFGLETAYADHFRDVVTARGNQYALAA